MLYHQLTIQMYNGVCENSKLRFYFYLILGEDGKSFCFVRGGQLTPTQKDKILECPIQWYF